MKIVYLHNITKNYSGDAVQGDLLAKHLNAVVMPPAPIQGEKAGIVKVDDYYYAVNDMLAGIDALNPDIVFIHTITPALLKVLPQIAQSYITVMRLAVNFEEIGIQPTGNLLADFWNILKMMDCIVCPSQFALRNLRRLGYRNTVHIPTCIDTAQFTPTDGRENNILAVGRLGPIKNVVTILLAFSSVVDEIPDARLGIVGSGPLYNVYRSMVRNIGLQSRVSFMGFRSALPYYRRAKIFVQSSFSENGSLTVLEALASGLPCVLSDIGGHKYDVDAIQYVKHDDVDGFAEAMIRLLIDDELWIELHRKALIGVRKYDVGEVKERYFELFEKLMKIRSLKR